MSALRVIVEGDLDRIVLDESQFGSPLLKEEKRIFPLWKREVENEVREGDFLFDGVVDVLAGKFLFANKCSSRCERSLIALFGIDLRQFSCEFLIKRCLELDFKALRTPSVTRWLLRSRPASGGNLPWQNTPVREAVPLSPDCPRISDERQRTVIVRSS